MLYSTNSISIRYPSSIASTMYHEKMMLLSVRAVQELLDAVSTHPRRQLYILHIPTVVCIDLLSPVGPLQVKCASDKDVNSTLIRWLLPRV